MKGYILTNYQELIRDIPDFPKKGIQFKDITPVISNPDSFRQVIKEMSSPFLNKGLQSVVAVEARGYIFGAPIANHLGTGFTPVRKSGKLPWITSQIEYSLEYGSATLEIHQDALRNGDRVLLVDDILATGGTLYATAQLVEGLGATVEGIAVLAEIVALKGSSQLKKYDLLSLMKV